MTNILLAALLLAPLAARCADADTKTLRVFIFAGQSNMVGTHSKVEQDEKLVITTAGIAQLGELLAQSYLAHR